MTNISRINAQLLLDVASHPIHFPNQRTPVNTGLKPTQSVKYLINVHIDKVFNHYRIDNIPKLIRMPSYTQPII